MVNGNKISPLYGSLSACDKGRWCDENHVILEPWLTKAMLGPHSGVCLVSSLIHSTLTVEIAAPLSEGGEDVTGATVDSLVLCINV